MREKKLRKRWYGRLLRKLQRKNSNVKQNQIIDRGFAGAEEKVAGGAKTLVGMGATTEKQEI